ncbi:MAG: hypothetical protein IJU26_03335, partial [Synergistaceae bacterium]|nr:hypothetical protein [Synergistaceae bacterium]
MRLHGKYLCWLLVMAMFCAVSFGGCGGSSSSLSGSYDSRDIIVPDTPAPVHTPTDSPDSPAPAPTPTDSPDSPAPAPTPPASPDSPAPAPTPTDSPDS